jgi:hypothetical protein
VNRLLGTTLGVLLLITPSLLGQSPTAETTRSKPSLAWSWPWARTQSAAFTTAILPNPGPVVQRDRAAADYQARVAWRRERNEFQRRHRAELERYVETRLALAEERARVEIFRAAQFARSTGGSAIARGDRTDLSTPALSAAGAWVANPNQNSTARPPRTVAERLSETATHIVREVPKRTKQIIDGSDALVSSNMANGLPKGLAVLIALLMLHVPSVAVVSLVTGVFLVRSHRTHAGTFFLSVAAILIAVIFFVLPW